MLTPAHWKMVVIIGRATLPDSAISQINGAVDIFIIDGKIQNRKLEAEVLENLKMLKKGKLEYCSFTTREGIEVRNERMRIADVTHSKEQSTFSFRIILTPEGVRGTPSEALS